MSIWWRPSPSAGRIAARCGGFSMLELQVTLVVLATGLFTFGVTLRTHALQMRRAEAWCRCNPTLCMVSQTSGWMRQLNAPAELEDDAGGTAWNPAVTGEQQYKVRLDSASRNLDEREMSADVTLQEAGG